eukprot:765539-Hanusia_phi.AAC.7
MTSQNTSYAPYAPAPLPQTAYAQVRERYHGGADGAQPSPATAMYNPGMSAGPQVVREEAGRGLTWLAGVWSGARAVSGEGWDLQPWVGEMPVSAHAGGLSKLTHGVAGSYKYTNVR